MKFRLTSLLWAFALSASALATFGDAGIAISAIVIGLWAIFFFETRRETGWLVAIIVVVLLLAVLVPLFRTSIESDRQSVCIRNLRQLSIALTEFASARGEYPVAARRGPNKQHAHSWRYRIISNLDKNSSLPYEYDPNEPWNGPKNSKLINKTEALRLFRCPSHNTRDNSTQYYAVVGENTAWPPDRGRRLSEITDGTSSTILLIEDPHKSTSWAKPEDLSFQEAVELLTSPPQDRYFGHTIDQGYFYKPYQGINVVFCHGNVETLRLPVPKEVAVAMLTVDGDEPVGFWEFKQVRNPELDYGRIYGLGMFLVLSLLPIVKLRAKKREALVVESEESDQ